MLIFLSLFLFFGWAADPVHQTFSQYLDGLDAIKTDKKQLEILFVEELRNLQSLLQEDLSYYDREGYKNLIRVMQANGNFIREQAVGVKMTFSFLANDMLPFMEKAIKKYEDGHLVKLLDQCVHLTLHYHSFFTTMVFFSDNGSSTAISTAMLYKMPMRYSNPKGWIRIVANNANMKRGDTSLGISSDYKNFKKIDEALTSFMISRCDLTEAIIHSLLKMEYICKLLYPTARLLFQECDHLILPVKMETTLAVAFSSNEVDHEAAYLLSSKFAERNKKMAFKFWTLIEKYSGRLAFEVEDKFDLDEFMKLVLEKNQGFLIQRHPGMFKFFEERLGLKVAPEAGKAVQKSGRLKGKARNQKEKEKAGKNVNSEGKSKKAKKQEKPEVKKPSKYYYDSDTEEIDQEPIVDDEMVSLSAELSSLEIESWSQSQAWNSATLLAISEYCVTKLLNPEREKRYPNQTHPIDFKWKMWAQDANENLAFCAKVASLRNHLVHSDDIFQFLLDTGDIAKALTSPTFGVIDKRAIDFIVSYAPGKRLIEDAEKPVHTFLTEYEARKSLVILGMHRACLRIKSAEVNIREVTSLCQKIASVRNKEAHPLTVNDGNFSDLKAEITPWVAVRFALVLY